MSSNGEKKGPGKGADDETVLHQANARGGLPDYIDLQAVAAQEKRDLERREMEQRVREAAEGPPATPHTSKRKPAKLVMPTAEEAAARAQAEKEDVSLATDPKVAAPAQPDPKAAKKAVPIAQPVSPPPAKKAAVPVARGVAPPPSRPKADEEALEKDANDRPLPLRSATLDEVEHVTPQRVEKVEVIEQPGFWKGLVGGKPKVTTGEVIVPEVRTPISREKAIKDLQDKHAAWKNSVMAVKPKVDIVYDAVKEILDAYNYDISQQAIEAFKTAQQTPAGKTKAEQVENFKVQIKRELSQRNPAYHTLMGLEHQFNASLKKIHDVTEAHVVKGEEPTFEIQTRQGQERRVELADSLTIVPISLGAFQQSLERLKNMQSNLLPQRVREPVSHLVTRDVDRIIKNDLLAQFTTDKSKKAGTALDALIDYVQHPHYLQRENIAHEPALQALRAEQKKFEGRPAPIQPQIEAVYDAVSSALRVYTQHINDYTIAYNILHPGKPVDSARIKEALANGKVNGPLFENEDPKGMKEAYATLNQVETTFAAIQRLRAITNRHVRGNAEPSENIAKMVKEMGEGLIAFERALSPAAFANTKDLPAAMQEQMGKLRQADYIVREDIVPYFAPEIQFTGPKKPYDKEFHGSRELYSQLFQAKAAPNPHQEELGKYVSRAEWVERQREAAKQSDPTTPTTPSVRS